MKKYLILSLCLIASCAMAVFGQTTQQSNWTSKDRSDFLTECIKAARAGMSTDSARYYCHCMLEKIEVKYPSTEDAAKISEEDLQSPEWQKMVRSCLVGKWTTGQRDEFRAECIDEAKKNLSEAKAISYCDCMMYKVEKRYPLYLDAQKLTEEDLKKPDWKKIIVGCLE